MNQLELFQKDAIRTESRIDVVDVNEQLLGGVISTIIFLGNILDAIKKNTFYGKEIDNNQIKYSLTLAQNNIDFMLDNDSVAAPKNRLPVNPRIFHAVIGTVTESVELLEALDLYKAEVDNVNIAEEFGDINWYQAIAFDEMDVDWQTVLDQIIAKLRSRYPDKFTSENAINRDLNSERTILEEITEPITNPADLS